MVSRLTRMLALRHGMGKSVGGVRGRIDLLIHDLPNDVVQ